MLSCGAGVDVDYTFNPEETALKGIESSRNSFLFRASSLKDAEIDDSRLEEMVISAPPQTPKPGSSKSLIQAVYDIRPRKIANHIKLV